jgi:hypothetical protein
MFTLKALFWLVLKFNVFLIDLVFSVLKELWLNVRVAIILSPIDSVFSILYSTCKHEGKLEEVESYCVKPSHRWGFTKQLKASPKFPECLYDQAMLTRENVFYLFYRIEIVFKHAVFT